MKQKRKNPSRLAKASNAIVVVVICMMLLGLGSVLGRATTLPDPLTDRIFAAWAFIAVLIWVLVRKTQ